MGLKIMRTNHQGLKPLVVTIFFGTTEVMPCYKERFLNRALVPGQHKTLKGSYETRFFF
jgi:hypothetical protein